jgi:endoglucanase
LGGVFDRRDQQPGWRALARHLDELVTAGFGSVRLPVRWWGHSQETRPFTLDRRFLQRVVELVDAVSDRGLSVILTMHHADGVCTDPRQEGPRLAALWEQISQQFADHSASLAFELLNEPRACLTPSAWNALLPSVVGAVRAVDPDRLVVVGGAESSTLAGLRQLELPPDDHLVATMHYYEPFPFTHQGANWEPGSDAWTGTGWGTSAEFAAVTADLEEGARWASQRRVVLYVGEFGTIGVADPESRIRWTKHVRRELDRLGLPWAYWDFATDFGLYDLEQSRWRSALRQAVLG